MISNFFLYTLFASSSVFAKTATLTLKRFHRTSAVASHPSVTLTVEEDGYKIISGGAYTNRKGAGQFLTAMYPVGTNQWVASSKDHKISARGTVSAVALGLHDPNDEWEVIVTKKTSAKVQNPFVSTSIAPTHRMTGGGAFDHWTGAGNLLYGSYPDDRTTWSARGKDHITVDPAILDSFAIGIRHKESGMIPNCYIQRAESGLEAYPSIEMTVSPGRVMVGGGGFMTQTGGTERTFLTESYAKDLNTWRVAGKGQGESDQRVAQGYLIECDTEFTYEVDAGSSTDDEASPPIGNGPTSSDILDLVGNRRLRF